jgi:hypothetical protein
MLLFILTVAITAVIAWIKLKKIATLRRLLFLLIFVGFKTRNNLNMSETNNSVVITAVQSFKLFWQLDNVSEAIIDSVLKLRVGNIVNFNNTQRSGIYAIRMSVKVTVATVAVSSSVDSKLTAVGQLQFTGDLSCVVGKS